MTGRLYGVGVGPGDPELLTLKAARVLMSAPVIVWPAPLTGDGMARQVAAAHIPPGRIEIALRMSFDPAAPPPDSVYDAGAAAIAGHLDSGRDVAVLCEGDPLFYGSFAYLLARLGDYPVTVVPGVASPMACAAALARPLTVRDEALAVVPATLAEDRLAAALEPCESAVVMKLGRHLPKVRRVLERLGRADAAVVVAWAGHERQWSAPLSEVAEAPYFSIVLVRK